MRHGYVEVRVLLSDELLDLADLACVEDARIDRAVLAAAKVSRPFLDRAARSLLAACALVATRESALLGVLDGLSSAPGLLSAERAEEVGLLSLLRGAGRVDSELAAGEANVRKSALAGVFVLGVEQLVFQVPGPEPRAFRGVVFRRDHLESLLLLLARLSPSHVLPARPVLLVQLR